jgi:hypothetical protein
MLFSVQVAFAQPQRVMIFKSPFSLKHPPSILKNDSADVIKFLQNHRSYLSDNNKALENGYQFNAFPEKLPMPAYKGNNGAGFDIYESTVDNMPLLVPDKTNPAIKPNTPKLENFYRVPEQTPGYQIYKTPQLVKPL